ncbi:shikimate dehydrogenase [Deinococcus sp.]|uniref:shikimate dehydrogenase n=1 Tax=Deinococcus sp. TaxID=47478 RepID=UPI0025C4D249|nr:shikimate dehydrogenase [Deinococcus sp.]
MFTPADAPVALVGYPTEVGRALRELGIPALDVPTEHPKEVAQACQTLRFAGALVAPGQQGQWLGAAQADPEARRVGRIDAVAFHGAAGASGTFAYADALSDMIEASGYSARGASLAVLGNTAADLALAAPLARLGFSDIGLVADSAPEAEKAIRDLPTGLRIFPMSRRDASVKALVSRSDLVVLATGDLPTGLLEPYHTLLDLTGRVSRSAVSGTLLDLAELQLFHLARQLLHATGQRFAPEQLRPLAAAARGTAAK